MPLDATSHHRYCRCSAHIATIAAAAAATDDDDDDDDRKGATRFLYRKSSAEWWKKGDHMHSSLCDFWYAAP